MQRIVVQPGQIQGETLTLGADQQHYLVRVLRLEAGAAFVVLDGQGEQWTAHLNADLTTATLVPISSAGREAEPTIAITLAAALPKQGFDEVVRQVTELGVQRIVPILSDRTLLRPSDHKLQRWRRIAAEAAEQSERVTVPSLDAPQSWTEWLATSSPGGECRWLCVARGDAPHLLAQGHQDWPLTALTLAIGPEGGWAEPEVASAIAAGYQPISLGPGILRAVTAPIAAIALIQGIPQFAKII